MSAAIIAAVGTVAAAGASIYSATASSGGGGGAAGPSQSQIRAAAGTVPKAAEYEPVDFNEEQMRSVWGNYNALPAIGELTKQTNKFITNDALKRINQLVPGFSSSMAKYGNAANSLLSGQLPFNDVNGIIGDRNGASGALGIPGTGLPATMRDLGLSELDAMKTGGGFLKDMTGIAETISPISRYMTPQSFFISPMDRIKLETEQRQLVQQSDQNKYNLEAEGDPAARLALGLDTAKGGAVSGGSGAGIASSIGPAISSIAGLAGAISGPSGPKAGAGGFYGTEAAAQAAYGGSSSYKPPVAYYGGSGQPGANSGWYLGV